MSMIEEINKLIEEKIEELYNSLMEKPLQVLSIFNEFFGEERVDMQGYISLERFKEWMLSSSIKEYTNSDILTSISSNKWDMYRSINELPEYSATILACSLLSTNIREIIGCSKFDNIFILVHFPHVRITNEHDRFVDINHLWAKINICYKGTLKDLGLNRSEYTTLQMYHNYLHSHVNSIPTTNFTKFQTPCMGDGPIKGTTNNLEICYNEDVWNMFCLELSKYVTVESIIGTPYHYLENLNTRSSETIINDFLVYTSLHYYYGRNSIPISKFKDFVRHFINTKKLKFNYVNGSYSIGMSLPEYIILISNEFISWYNKLFNEGEVICTFYDLKMLGLLKKCVIYNNKIYYYGKEIDTAEYSSYIGKKVCMFKGKEITISITDIDNEHQNESIILNPATALYILKTILNVLNYKYGRDTDITTENSQYGTKTRYL